MTSRDYDFEDSEFDEFEDSEIRCPHDECDEDGVCFECGEIVPGREGL